MKRLAVFVVLALLGLGILPANAQVIESARHSQLSLTAGGMASYFQPDYYGNGIPQASVNRIWGVGTYVDLRLSRWVQIEGEARWMRFNTYRKISEDNYLIGPRVPIHRFHRLGATPYAKVLIGLGKMNFENNDAYGRFTDLALGGGVDLMLTRRISLRAVDFEYQDWPNWVNGTLKPYGVSAGIAYKIF